MSGFSLSLRRPSCTIRAVRRVFLGFVLLVGEVFPRGCRGLVARVIFFCIIRREVLSGKHACSVNGPDGDSLSKS